MKLHVDLSKDIKLPKETGLPFFRVALKSVETVLLNSYNGLFTVTSAVAVSLIIRHLRFNTFDIHVAPKGYKL